MAYIYLLCEDNDRNMVKIGVTRTTVENRIKKMQTGNGNKICILMTYQTDIPFKIETMLHHYYQEERQEGEWFLLSDEQISEFAAKCEEFQKIMDSLKENPFVFKNKTLLPDSLE